MIVFIRRLEHRQTQRQNMYRQSENIVSVSKEERSQKKPQFCWLFDLRLLVSRIIKNNTSTFWATKSQSVTLFKASLIYRLTLNSWIWLLPLFMVNISASTLLLIIFICCSRLFFFLSLFYSSSFKCEFFKFRFWDSLEEIYALWQTFVYLLRILLYKAYHICTYISFPKFLHCLFEVLNLSPEFPQLTKLKK